MARKEFDSRYCMSKNISLLQESRVTEKSLLVVMSSPSLRHANQLLIDDALFSGHVYPTAFYFQFDVSELAGREVTTLLAPLPHLVQVVRKVCL